jgi:hypothetical protein
VAPGPSRRSRLNSESSCPGQPVTGQSLTVPAPASPPPGRVVGRTVTVTVTAPVAGTGSHGRARARRAGAGTRAVTGVTVVSVTMTAARITQASPEYTDWQRPWLISAGQNQLHLIPIHRAAGDWPRGSRSEMYPAVPGSLTGKYDSARKNSRNFFSLTAVRCLNLTGIST